VERGHAPEVLCLKMRRSGNPLYLSYLALFLFYYEFCNICTLSRGTYSFPRGGDFAVPCWNREV
jgi:hypothetical protein